MAYLNVLLNKWSLQLLYAFSFSMTQYKNWKLPSYFNNAITLLACVLALLWILVSLRFQRLRPSTEILWTTTGSLSPKYAFATILTAEGDV